MTTDETGMANNQEIGLYAVSVKSLARVIKAKGGYFEEAKIF